MSSFNKNDDVIDITPKRISKYKPVIILGVVLFAALILFFSSFYTLESSEQGVIMRFGKVEKVEKQSGAHFKLPFIDHVYKVDVTTLYSMEYGYRTTTTGTTTAQATYTMVDSEATIIVNASNGGVADTESIEEAEIIEGTGSNASIALIEMVIQYKVVDPVAYLFNVDNVEGTLRLVLEDAIRTSVQAMTLDDVKTKKAQIDTKVLQKLRQKMNDYGAGIEITYVGTQNVNLLPNVATAYQQKENANQYNKGKLEEAQRYENTVLPQANAEAEKLKEEAYAYKAETIAKAKSAVAQFNALYEEYKKNPQILKEKYYIEAMTDFIKNNNLIIDMTEGGDIYKFYNMNESDLVKEQITTLPQDGQEGTE